MEDLILKQEIIKKHITMMTDSELEEEIMRCMEEWAGIISKRIEDTIVDEIFGIDDEDDHLRL